MSVRPADFPPPWSVGEAFRPPTDPADERIEVGFLIVGAGPAGLAAAIRLGQLIEASPEVAERLGDVPVAVLEKGKSPGAHLLSGAVVNPRALQELFRGRKRLDEFPFAGPVERESVLFLTRKHSYRIPTPPTMANDRNQIVSLCAARRLAGRGGGGARRDDAPRDGGGLAAGRRRSRARRAHRRPRAGPPRCPAAELRGRARI